MPAPGKDQFRADICAAALPMFLERAVADVSIQAVADKIGASFWSVYRQYGSRELLYRAAIEPLIAEVAGLAGRSPKISTSVRAALAACVQHAATLMQRATYRRVLLLVVRDGLSQGWLAADYEQRIIEPLCRGIEQAVRRAGSEQGLLVGITPGAARRAIRQLEAQLVMPRLLPGADVVVEAEASEIRDALIVRLIGATYAIDAATVAA